MPYLGTRKSASGHLSIARPSPTLWSLAQPAHAASPPPVIDPSSQASERHGLLTAHFWVDWIAEDDASAGSFPRWRRRDAEADVGRVVTGVHHIYHTHASGAAETADEINSECQNGRRVRRCAGI